MLDGAGADSAVTQALGSLRFQVTITGPGGHSFTDAGTPNPDCGAGRRRLLWSARRTLPDEPRTTLNLGTIRRRHKRELDPGECDRIHRFSIDQSRRTDAARSSTSSCGRRCRGTCQQNGQKSMSSRSRGPLTFSIQAHWRPARRAACRQIRRCLKLCAPWIGIWVLRTDLRLGSTDANIPIARGIPALSMGAGGDGGGAHTLGEWYSDKDRELGLRRALLLTLAIAEWAAEQ